MSERMNVFTVRPCAGCLEWRSLRYYSFFKTCISRLLGFSPQGCGPFRSWANLKGPQGVPGFQERRCLCSPETQEPRRRQAVSRLAPLSRARVFCPKARLPGWLYQSSVWEMSPAPRTIPWSSMSIGGSTPLGKWESIQRHRGQVPRHGE